MLRAQAAVLAELRELVAQQRQALMQADEQRLLELASKAETYATRFALLEQERLHLEAVEPGHTEEQRQLRDELATALAALLREAAVAGTVLERFGETLWARHTAHDPLGPSSYRADGRAAIEPQHVGQKLRAEG